MKIIGIVLALVFSVFSLQAANASERTLIDGVVVSQSPIFNINADRGHLLIAADAASCGVGQKVTQVACGECGQGYKKTRAFSVCKQSTDQSGTPCGGIGCEPCTCTPN